MDDRNKILNSIIEINENNNVCTLKGIKLEYSANKYSSNKESVWHIILNDKQLTKKNKHIFKYKCITCNSIHSVGTTQFLRKLNKGSLYCYLCRNKNVVKRIEHSNKMKGNTFASNMKPEEEKEIIIIKTPLDLKKESEELFNQETSEFKKNYFCYHLTYEDYSRISKNLISLHNNNFNKISDYEFWPIFKTNNQMLYSSVLYDIKQDIIFKGHQPIMRCDICNQNWRAKSLEKFKDDLKILCKDCSLVNKIFKIRRTANCDNKLLLYQSNLELKFIDWCNSNNIIVTNGPKVPYSFENKDRTYKVDFQIKNILVEIKDEHIWHKNDIKSGKWQAKEQAVFKLINEGKYKDYYLIKPSNWNEYLNKINKI